MKRRWFSLLCVLNMMIALLCGCASETCGAYGINDFSVDTPADEILAAVKEDGWVVTEDSRVSAGEETMRAFYAACMRGESGSVLIASYHTLDPEHVSAELYAQEKDSYPRIFLTELSFDGEKYRVVTRYSVEAEPETDSTYAHLVHLTGDAPTPYARFDRYDRYVLADNAEITMEAIDRAILSSTLVFGEEEVGRWKFVYTNLIGDGNP